jgi:hypothetical protein
MADDPPTLEDLALKFKVSPERVRQIETMAFEKVRKAAKNISGGFAGALDDVVECGSPNLNRTAQCLPTGG